MSSTSRLFSYSEYRVGPVKNRELFILSEVVSDFPPECTKVLMNKIETDEKEKLSPDTN